MWYLVAWSGSGVSCWWYGRVSVGVLVFNGGGDTALFSGEIASSDGTEVVLE